jgi:hypothetical protein
MGHGFLLFYTGLWSPLKEIRENYIIDLSEIHIFYKKFKKTTNFRDEEPRGKPRLPLQFFVPGSVPTTTGSADCQAPPYT